MSARPYNNSLVLFHIKALNFYPCLSATQIPSSSRDVILLKDSFLGGRTLLEHLVV